MEKDNFLIKSTILFLAVLTLSFSVHATTKVSITFMEALASTDSTSSERFKKEYEQAIQTGKNLTKKQLSECGYELDENKVFYDASDTLQALEKAKQAQDSKTWLIIAPRRSNHYLLVAKGADQTPAVSIMASAKEVYELGSLHLTLAQSNQEMASVLATESQKSFKNKKAIKYISIVSEDCVSCIDFSKSFDQKAKSLKMKKIDEFKVSGEQPDISHLKAKLNKDKPDIVLLPNYSKLSSYIISFIKQWAPKTLFLGGDGWGDNKYGFVHHSPQLEGSEGMTVKGFPPTEVGLSYFDLGKELLKNPKMTETFPSSGSAQSLLIAIESTVNLLCKYKPKDQTEFTAVFKKYGKDYFKNPWGVSLFSLKDGKIDFMKTVR